METCCILLLAVGGRHISLDIGHGFFMHVGKEYETISIGVIDGFGWEKGGTTRMTVQGNFISVAYNANENPTLIQLPDGYSYEQITDNYIE